MAWHGKRSAWKGTERIPPMGQILGFSTTTVMLEDEMGKIPCWEERGREGERYLVFD